MKEIQITLTSNPKAKPKDDKLGFGSIFTDHMFVMDYNRGEGWHSARIVPYGPFEVEPSMMVLHYGQSIFEGLKAYKNIKGEIVTFRPRDNFARINVSAERLCIPQIDSEFAWEALKKLLEIDKDWVPSLQDTSLYIRPFIIATDPFLGVRPSDTYKFFIILSPVGAYYPEGFMPVKIYVTDKYVRAAKGGIGYAKTAGNYAASLYAAEEAKAKGYTQVLWLDAGSRCYVEEVGTMNIFFKFKDTLITPPLEGGSILAGITRDSVIKLCKHLGINVEERPVSIEEVYKAHSDQTLMEIFGAGTAAVISPVGEMNWNGSIIEIGGGKTGNFSAMMYDKLTGIQCGREEDPFQWIQKICG